MKFKRINDGFCILPTIDVVWINWIYKDNRTTRVYDIRLSWLRWMLTTDRIVKFINDNHY